MDNEFIEVNKKSPVVTILCVVLIVALLGVVGFGFVYKNKPEVVFSSLVNKVSKETKKKVDFKQSKLDFDLSLNVDAGSEYKTYTDLINNILLKMSINTDLNTKEVSATIKADYKSKELLNVDAYYGNKTAYINLNDLFDKVISSPVEIEESNVKLTQDDINTLTEEVINAFKAALKEGKYSSNKVDLNGAKVTKNVVTINSENGEKVQKAFIEYLKKSDKFLTVFSKLTEEKKEDMVKELNEVEYEKIEKDVNICVYTKGLNNELVKLSVESDNKEIIGFTEKSSKVYELKAGIDGNTLTCEIKDLGNNKSTGTCNMEIEGIKVSYTMNVEAKYNEALKKLDTTNAIPYTELKEEDVSKIMENLTKKDSVKDFMEVISSFMNQEPNIEE